MQTIEELNAEYAAKLANLTAEHALAALLPIPPKFVQLNSRTIAPWATYEAASLVDAISLLERMGDVTPFYAYKGTFTRFQPVDMADDKSGAIVGGPYSVSLSVSHGRGYGPDSTLMAFYRLSSGQLVKVRVGVKDGNHAFMATAIRDSNSRRGEGDRIVDFRANNVLASAADKMTKWGTGSPDSAHFEYSWSSDDVDGGTGHAFGQLWIIAEAQRRNTFLMSPMVESFLSVMLEDMQITEREEAAVEERDERDIGTIWNCPESTFAAARDYARAFERSFMDGDDMTAVLNRNEEQAGSDLYLHMAGHGAGFADRNCWSDEPTDSEDNARIAARLSEAADKLGRIETYVGDDGRAYISGKE